MAIIVWDDTGGDSLASTGSNWVGNVAPGTADTAQFDATAVTACTWDIAEVTGIDVQAAYSGVVTQSVALTVTGAYTINGSNSTPWVTANTNLDLKGNVVTGGAGNGLIHNAGAIVRFGANIDIDKADMDSNCELFDFTGGGVNSVFRFTVGSTELPALFTIRNGCQMRVNGGSTLADVQVDSGGSIIDNSVTSQLTLRGDLTTTDLVGAILSTAPGNLTLAFNATTMPGGDYGTADAQTTSAVVVMQGNVTNVNLLKVYRTFTATPGMLTSNGFSIACALVDIGSPTQVSRGGVLELESGSSFTCDGVLNINETDGLLDHESIIDVQAGSGNISVGGMNVEALAEFDGSAVSTTLTCSGSLTLAATSVIDWGSMNLVLNGSAAQSVTMKGNPVNMTLAKTGGSVAWVNAWTISGTYTECALANVTVTWLVAGAYVCNAIRTLGMASFEVSNVSSTPASTYQITVSVLGPINRNSGWADCNIVGAYIRVDLLTGSNDCGNDVVSPNGIDFRNFQKLTAFGYGVHLKGVGIGIGLSLGH